MPKAEDRKLDDGEDVADVDRYGQVFLFDMADDGLFKSHMFLLTVIAT